MKLNEIDYLIATKVMGWKLRKHYEDDCYITDEWVMDIRDKFNNGVVIVDVNKFNPTTNMNQALMAAEKFTHKHPIVENRFSISYDGYKYHALIYYFDKNYRSYAETAPLALCLTLLKAEKVKVKYTEV